MTFIANPNATKERPCGLMCFVCHCQHKYRNMKWEPIEAAPRDGTNILLSDGRFVVIGYYGLDFDDNPVWFCDEISWEDGRIVESPTCNPIYWMPLPDPPKL